jgi:hypothetical protein
MTKACGACTLDGLCFHFVDIVFVDDKKRILSVSYFVFEISGHAFCMEGNAFNDDHLKPRKTFFGKKPNSKYAPYCLDPKEKAASS